MQAHTREETGLRASQDVLMKAEYPNHVWRYDFTEDRTERGGKLHVVDEFTLECHQIRVDRSIGSAKVIASLEWQFFHFTAHHGTCTCVPVAARNRGLTRISNQQNAKYYTYLGRR